MTAATVNGNWLRKKATDPTVKALFRATRQGDYVAALALLDRLCELGHDRFAGRLRHTVGVQSSWPDDYRAGFVSWRVDEFMSKY